MHQPGEREQRLVGGDVRGRLLAPDVLLARLQGQHIAALTRGVHRLADDPAGQPADVVGARGEEAVVRAAVAHRVARATAPRRSPSRSRSCPAPRARRATPGRRARSASPPPRSRRPRARARPRGTPKKFGCWKMTAAAPSAAARTRVGIGRAALVRHLDDLEAEAGRVGLHDLAHLRARRLGDDDLRAAGRVLRDEARVGGDRRAVVARRVRDVHAGQLADRGLVLEDRLQHALAHLGLVRRVRGQELAALQHRVDDRGHVVVVDARAEEADLVDDVLRRRAPPCAAAARPR